LALRWTLDYLDESLTPEMKLIQDMEFKFVNDETEIDSFFREAFNPPLFDNEFAEKDYDKEYWRVYSAIRDNLSQYGKFSYSVDGDFAMNETRGAASRWISVCFTTDKMWNPNVFESIAGVLDQQQQDYMVYLSHDVIEHPLFHVLVSKICAIGYCDEPTFLEALGFFKGGNEGE
jgi:hypothetical protein